MVENQICCPDCGSYDWVCYDEQTITHYGDDGTANAIEVIGRLKCRACGNLFNDVQYYADDDTENEAQDG